MIFHRKLFIYFFIVLAIFLILPLQIFADHNQTTSKNLHEDLYTVYELVEAEKYNAATTKVEQILDAVMSGHLSLPTERMEFVKDTLRNSIQVIGTDSISKEWKLSEIDRIMLMLYTAKYPENQMFVTFKNELRNQVLDALESDSIDFEKQFLDSVEQYRQVLPALKMVQPVEKWNNLDAQMELMTNDTVINYEEMEDSLHVLLNLFEVKEVTTIQKDEDPSFIWGIFTVGGAIIVTLIYVGWRKYKGEKKGKKYKKVDGS